MPIEAARSMEQIWLMEQVESEGKVGTAPSGTAVRGALSSWRRCIGPRVDGILPPRACTMRARRRKIGGVWRRRIATTHSTSATKVKRGTRTAVVTPPSESPP